jgi:hypothetical protein
MNRQYGYMRDIRKVYIIVVWSQGGFEDGAKHRVDVVSRSTIGAFC